MSVTTDCVSYMQKVFFSENKNNTGLVDPSNATVNNSARTVLKLRPEGHPAFLHSVCDFATQSILKSLYNFSIIQQNVGDNQSQNIDLMPNNCSSNE